VLWCKICRFGSICINFSIQVRKKLRLLIIPKPQAPTRLSCHWIDNSKLAMASADISGFDPRKGRGGGGRCLTSYIRSIEHRWIFLQEDIEASRNHMALKATFDSLDWFRFVKSCCSSPFRLEQHLHFQLHGLSFAIVGSLSMCKATWKLFLSCRPDQSQDN
jgi:hypothetical protein